MIKTVIYWCFLAVVILVVGWVVNIGFDNILLFVRWYIK